MRSEHPWIRRVLSPAFVAWLATLLLLASVPALASSERSCPSVEQRAALSGFGERVASKATVQAAQKLALSKLRAGRVGLQRAHVMFPNETSSLGEADRRMDVLEAAVMGGSHPAEVAAPFQRLAANGSRCDYDKVEIVVIVVGFVLGILPGIIPTRWWMGARGCKARGPGPQGWNTRRAGAKNAHRVADGLGATVRRAVRHETPRPSRERGVRASTGKGSYSFWL